MGRTGPVLRPYHVTVKPHCDMIMICTFSGVVHPHGGELHYSHREASKHMETDERGSRRVCGRTKRLPSVRRRGRPGGGGARRKRPLSFSVPVRRLYGPHLNAPARRGRLPSPFSHTTTSRGYDRGPRRAARTTPGSGTAPRHVYDRRIIIHSFPVAFCAAQPLHQVG